MDMGFKKKKTQSVLQSMYGDLCGVKFFVTQNNFYSDSVLTELTVDMEPSR